MVGDADASVAKAKQLGGSVVVPPTDIPDAGRFSVLKDPQGAVFAVFRPPDMP
jgi:predicted enzyme related to lactoylglutathione lyase